MEKLSKFYKWAIVALRKAGNKTSQVVQHFKQQFRLLIIGWTVLRVRASFRKNGFTVKQET